jgi:hypothetical protein
LNEKTFGVFSHAFWRLHKPNDSYLESACGQVGGATITIRCRRILYTVGCYSKKCRQQRRLIQAAFASRAVLSARAGLGEP